MESKGADLVYEASAFWLSGGQPGGHCAFRLPKANAMARVVSFAKEGAKETARVFQFAHLIEEGKVL